MSFPRFALRDLLVIAAAVTVWIYASPVSAGSGPLADLLGVAAGAGIGLSAYLLHEWGHLLAALGTGSVVHPGRTLGSRYLFSFDSKRNDRRQFLIMSVGGFVVTALAMWLVYAGLPGDLFATRVARGVVSYLAFLTIFIELPLVVWALVSSHLPPVDTVSPDAPIDAGGRAV
jgi:ABC-type cobalamin transport system permease subunit